MGKAKIMFNSNLISTSTYILFFVYLKTIVTVQLSLLTKEFCPECPLRKIFVCSNFRIKK